MREARSATSFGHRYGPWALVTGASSGIGASFARELSARGLAVVLVARRRDRLEDLARELRERHGVETLALELDLGRDDAVAELVDGVGDRDIGLLCANAGFGEKGAFEALDRDVYRRMIRLNCESTVALVHRFVPHLSARGRGGVIIVSSLAAFQGTPFTTVYAATKAFDLHLAEGLAEELRPRGIDVCALCPGSTDTEGPRRTGVDPTQVPFGAASPDDVARAALDALGKRTLVLPRAIDRAAAFATRLVSRRFASRIAGRAMKKAMDRP